MKEKLQKMCCNAIRLNIEGQAQYILGGTRFGGLPDVPSDFVWPTFETSTYDDNEIKQRPLSFIAQFNCAEISQFDKEKLLPTTGLLSFFYEVGSQRYGYNPKDSGCACVYWFEDTSILSKRKFPSNLDYEFRFPQIKIDLKSEISIPEWDDFSIAQGLDFNQHDDFEKLKDTLGYETPKICSKLLGWADILQTNMTQECELVSRGYNLDYTRENIPQIDLDESLINDWRLLFQLDTVSDRDFELMFGDCGRLYFYIRKGDLVKRNFNNIWLIWQCT